jgi:hypothetical protein
MKEISQIDLARLAAYVDGEGQISINAYHMTHRNGRRSQHTRAVIKVSNSDIRLIDWITNLVGVGTIHANMRTKRADERNWKPVYNWTCQNAKACQVIEAVLPYLILKRDQAEAVLAHQRLILTRTNRRFGIPPENLEQRMHLVSRVRTLNKRGIA